MTKFELVIPSSVKPVFEACLEIVKNMCFKWAYALHPADELANCEHYHLGVFLPSSRTAGDIYKWFAHIDFIKPNSIEKIKHHQNTYLTYLLHKTKDAIAAGKSDPLEFDCSDGLDFESAVSDYNNNFSIDELCAMLVDGTLRECDLYSDPKFYSLINKSSKNKSRVDNAVKIFYNRMIVEGANYMNGDNRKQAWIYGESGSGKTLFAKHIAKSCGYETKDIYVTASGKNPFDNYMGQKCVIIDDLDGDTMSPKTALKLMDMFTNSAIACRYSNKIISADCIIITSTVSPLRWWNNNAGSVDGDIKQLYRRLTLGCAMISGGDFMLHSFDKKGYETGTVTLALPEDVADIVCTDRNNMALDFFKAHYTIKNINGRDIDASVDLNNVKFDKDGNVHFGDGTVAVNPSKKDNIPFA